MLGFLRRGVKSWVAKVLLGILILSFAVWGLQDVFTSASNPSVAHVGDVDVPASRFAESMQRQRNALSQREGALVPYQQLREMGVDRQVLAALVRDAAFGAELAALGIAVPDEQVRETIRANPAFQDGQGGFSQFTYIERISQNGYDAVEFEDLTRAVLGQEILREAIGTGGVYIPGAAAMIARYQGEERAISYIVVPASTAAEPALPSDSDLAAFFAGNEDMFREPERRWGRVVRTDIATLAAGVTVTDEDVRAAYDSRKDAFTTPERREIEQIVFTDPAEARTAADRLAAGSASFAEIAAEQNISIDALSLGMVQRGDLAEASAEAAFGLAAPGIAGPIEGPFGTVLLNVTEIVPGGTTPFEDLADAIRTALIQQQVYALIPDRANMIDDIRAGGATMEEIAERTELPLATFGGLAADGSVAEGTLIPSLLDPRMMAEIMEASVGEERDIVEMSDESYALVMVDRVEASRVPPLGEIRDRVVAAWQAEQRLNAVEADAVRRIAQGAADLEALAAESDLALQSVPAFRRSGVPPFLSRALAQQVFAVEDGGIVVGRNSAGDGVIVARIDSVGGINEAAIIDQVDEIDASFAESLAQDYTDYFGRALEDRHGASLNVAVIEQIYEQLEQAGGF